MKKQKQKNALQHDRTTKYKLAQTSKQDAYSFLMLPMYYCQPCVTKSNLFNCLQFRPSHVVYYYFHIQDLSYCSGAFGSAVVVQIEMLKL